MVYRSFAIASKVERDWHYTSLSPFLYVNLALRCAALRCAAPRCFAPRATSPRSRRLRFPDAKPPFSLSPPPSISPLALAYFVDRPLPASANLRLEKLIACPSTCPCVPHLLLAPPPSLPKTSASTRCYLRARARARALTDAGFTCRRMRVSLQRTTINVSARTSHSPESERERKREGHTCVFASVFRDGHGRRFSRESYARGIPARPTSGNSENFFHSGLTDEHRAHPLYFGF